MRYRIGYMAGHACIRVQKMALPLMQRGHIVHMASQKIPSYADSYDTYTQTFSLHQMREWVKLVAPSVDFFHAHNEPSWFAALVKEVCDKPVILDVHDSFLARITPEQHDRAMDEGHELLRICVEERNNFQLADGLVFPSRPFADLIIREFGLKQPSVIMPSYIPRNLYGYQQNSDWRGGIVYEGRIDLPQAIEERKKFKAGFAYTDYSDFAKQCHALGIPFWIYSRQDKDFLEIYSEIAICKQPVVYAKLMQTISAHDWGLVGNSFYTPEWEVAEPNKLYEYIAAGVPIVAMNAAHCSEIIKEHGIGITVGSVKELADRWNEHEECRKRLYRVRGKFTMEENIGRLEDFYREVVA